MRVIRLYVNQNLDLDKVIKLNETSFHYAANVLRLNKNSLVTLFNGDGFNYPCHILYFKKKSLHLKILDKKYAGNESHLVTNLLLAISKSTKMDYAIQKSVEAGVTNIYPIFTEHSVYNKKNMPKNNKTKHWKKIIISASEQCGRAKLTNIYDPVCLNDIVKLSDKDLGLVLDKNSSQSLTSIKHSITNSIWVLVGPEGGLTTSEIEYVKEFKGYQSITFGPRVLRTETAALTAIISAQILWGDYK